MVQRILMLALVLLAFTMPTEAITYQELKTSPQFKFGSYSIDEWFYGEWWLVYLFEHVFH